MEDHHSRSSDSPPLTEMILDSVADGVFTVDAEMRIAYWNRGAENITGFSSDEALGSPCCEVFRASLCGDECPMKEAMKTGLPSGPTDVSIVTRALEEINVSISAAALRDRDGTFLGGVEAFRELNLPRRPPSSGSAPAILGIEGLVSRDPKMGRVLSILPAVAQADAPVLIVGRSGTGKKSVARAIHRLGSRAGNPVVTVSCAAVSEELQQADRAGKPSPADTGPLAVARQRAAGSTLLLHEISDLSPAAQRRLLRLLQREEFQPRQHRDDLRTRVVSTSSLDPSQAVREGRLREDLFFRLAVITVELPTLAQRSSDIPLLAERHLAMLSHRSGRQDLQLSPEALGLLLSHDYPGNVRELENILEHAMVVSRGSVIELQDLPPYLTRSQATSPEPHTTERISDDILLDSLKRNSGNRSRTARELGIHRSTLWRRMKKLGLDEPEDDNDDR